MASPPSSPAKRQAVPVRFLPFRSVAEPSFWLDHNSRKLNELRLSEEPVSMRGYFGAAPAGGGRAGAGNAGANLGVAAGMRFDSSSSAAAGDNINYIDSGEIPDGTSPTDEVRRNEWIRAAGQIRSLNTLESFKRLDKNQLLNGACLPRLLACCGVPTSDTSAESDTTTAEGAREESELDPNESLVTATCLAHCNLKTNVTVYWFAFPAMAPRPGCGISYSSQSTPQTRIGEAWGAAACRGLSRSFHRLRVGMERIHREERSGVWCPPFFLLVPSSDDEGGEHMKCLPLSHSSFEGLGEEEKRRAIFGFVDSNTAASASNKSDGASAPAAVGWTLRNLVAYASLKLGLGGQDRKFLSYRSPFLRRIAPAEEELDEGVGSDDHGMGMSGSYEDVGEAALGEDDAGVGRSLLLDVRIPLASDYKWPAGDPPTTDDATAAALASYRCVGWEANRNGKPGPRSVDLRPLVSPAHLSRQANDLNLRLMKWRALPSLDVEKLGQMKVAILGAGTLGCGVARTLLGWGVRRLTFVDSGKVSYSNPVRQSLFTVDDCKEGGKSKAVAAAESLAAIAGPDVEAKGVVLTIPMPGHSFGRGKDGDAEAAAVQKDVETLHNLIAESDVAFLLTDTRESRWLPTVLALATNTPLINAALGLDSWLVLRHGPPSSALATERQQRLGCYFCSDVVAPENSTRDRTLDQQCTVTRPGLAPIAASMASELAVAMVHHPMGHCAPAPTQKRNEGSGAYAPADDGADPSSSALGRLPHQIRGTVVTYTMMTPTVPAFPSCTACADGVVEAYRREGFDFVRKVCCDGDGSYLEEVSGLAGFREEAAKKLDECLDWDDEEEEE